MLLIHQISPFSKKDASYNTRKARSLETLFQALTSIASIFHRFLLHPCCCGRTIKIGSLLVLKTRSVTLPITQRCNPCRPCVEMAIKSQPVALPLFSSLSPCSASSTSALATSDAHKTEEVIESLSSFVLACHCSLTCAR